MENHKQESAEIRSQSKGINIIHTMLLLLAVALATLPVLLSAILGVIRGYSVQIDWLRWIVYSSAGATLCLLSIMKRAGYKKAVCLVFIFVFCVFIPVAKINVEKHERKGRELYKEGRYEEALPEFMAEVETWYLRLYRNSSESSAMYYLARTYSQLGDFHEAAETYMLVIDRYDDFYASEAKYSLEELESGLEELNKLSEVIESGKGDFVVFQKVAEIYEDQLNCHAKAQEYYHKALECDAEDFLKKIVKKRLEALNLQKSN